ncbi:nuclear transport factor 2 family protein [Arenibacter sp. F20364]|uniref:nuclear transport factor 2 family protein n=1 Tax=Arenibacter sp. F20364 TaxID=2926415 RepID=UPI001FF148C1|nr:nuclear transport factor 2 family protein [Arenibacter sp. F20364]MCK0191466.1 nuclear transport factor 2 family protein [Arenibacter sp. F20364]
MKLNIKPDCGNSPKKALVKNLTILFSSYDIEKAMDFLDDNVKWTLVGDESIIGKKQFRTALEEMSQNKALELTIHSIITHGKEAAVNGEMVMEDGNIFAFSDFYEFSSAKGDSVKSIVSYVIQKNKKPVVDTT